MTGGGAAAAEEEIATRKLVGAGFVKKVAHFFGQQAEKVSFTKHPRQVGPKASSAVDPMTSGNNASSESGDGKSVHGGEEERQEMALGTCQLGKDVSQDNNIQDKDARRQGKQEVDEEALKQKNDRIVSASSSEILQTHQVMTGYDNSLDAASVKTFVQQTVKEALSGAFDSTDGNSEFKGFVRDTVKQFMEEQRELATLPRDPIPRLDSMKLVQDAMSEHQTISRVLYVLALGTPITLLIARAVRDKDTVPDKKMIRNAALEMGFSFLAVTVCHLYVIIFHFVRTEAPRLSMRAARIIIVFLCTIVSSWILVYAFHMPEHLFQNFFWWIIGPVLAANWILSGLVGFTGWLKQRHVIKVDRS